MTRPGPKHTRFPEGKKPDAWESHVRDRQAQFHANMIQDEADDRRQTTNAVAWAVAGLLIVAVLFIGWVFA